MIQKVLIANRGEIALRIVRACRDLGIRSLVVYSQADEQSLAVQLADEAICIGPAPAKESYLRPERILAAAEIGNADALHPGYGFLSENESFAHQCEACGIRWIGPSSEVIAKMGDKATAKQMAKEAGVPVVPGSDGPVKDAKDALTWANKIGFPVIIKAVSGGGGKGMRVIEDAQDLQRELEVAQMEAKSSFGDASVYLEKYLNRPRHIEFQILGDSHGNLIHLGERECSLQRRHQKVIEEAPSPAMTPRLREAMGEASLRLARHVGYVNAGTIEYLVDESENFYFIEMNTRIQVEHGVTEVVTGVDLVCEQLRIAAGERLSLRQQDVTLEGHAIQARVCAEDPERNFAPSPGPISFYSGPGGPGIRVDGALYSGYSIPPYYDSLITKVISSGSDRTVAVDRLQRALQEMLIHGIKTNIPFLRALLEDDHVREGKIHTSFIPQFMKQHSSLFSNQGS